MIVGLCGKSGAGKDAVGKILTENVKGFHRLAFADALKRDVYELNSVDDVGNGMSLATAIDNFGWDSAKRRFPVIRAELQSYGMRMREEHGADYWISRLEKERVRVGKGLDDQHFVICDVRMPNEAEYVMSMSGMLIDVRRPQSEHSLSGTAAAHVSESMSIGTPYVINNDGTLNDLKDQVLSLLKVTEGTMRLGRKPVKSYSINGKLKCAKCQEWKPMGTEDFYRMSRMWRGFASYCKSCHIKFIKDKPYRSRDFRRIRESRSDSAREWDLKNKFGITLEEYNSMLDLQGGVCAICQKVDSRTRMDGTPLALAIDHDHETGEVRGLLCSRCNMSVGALGDSHESIMRVVEYLKPWAAS